ncbi:MAG: NADH-quinone oxidoreductase subunit C [Gammaproteobacteria bacterium]|nr:NADH-quinone oxidoreductase subunit C [Gammaproteobacteria bacterium]MBI5615290.1 NADH-quinone oxidoreductase subunit C [Gammaproteobacteria bacterium]
MLLSCFDTRLESLPAPLPIRHGLVDAEGWRNAAEAVRAGGARLVSLWATDRRPLGEAYVVNAAYAIPEGLVWIGLPLADEDEAYPDLTAHFPTAGRMQRAVRDLLGLHAAGARDQRPWLRHGTWPPDFFPLRHDAEPSSRFPEFGGESYAFVPVDGEGVHEIPVGPVHAGIIEPGHFRFSTVGEKVLRLEERLGYVHKGIEKRFESLAPAEAHRLAGRVSGDSTVAYAWAYCMALESAADLQIPQRAAALRAMMLERERVANHLGDLGALGNDAAFAFGLAQFSRLKEDWLRASSAAFGHRFMMDRVVPGGVACDVDTAALTAMIDHCKALGAEVEGLRKVYDGHAGLQDRFLTTGRVTPELATRLGLCGLAGRASGQPADLRCDHPTPPYDALAVQRAVRRNGDVAARVNVRFDELAESLRLIATLCARLPEGAIATPLTRVPAAARGAGWVEAWRGQIFVGLELDADGAIRRCHCHDPSWHNWPLLEYAVIGNIVPDFPLINKSFNLSYSGQDL